MRIRNSFGENHVNEGSVRVVNADTYLLDHTRKYYLIDIIPFGAVRMSRSDTWKTNPNHPDPKRRQRIEVTRYFAFKNSLVAQCNTLGYKIGGTFEAVYLIPMPDKWSEKKKRQHNGLPCLSKPDTDNITKGIKDALLPESDSMVWWEKAEKRWAYKGSIIIFE